VPVACVYDTETTFGMYLGRKGSPFSDGSINLCAAGFLFDDGEYQDTYFVREDEHGIRQGVPRGSAEWEESFPDLSGVDVLVGHNIKFDLLWYWRHPKLEAFIKRGGRIWDTQYAEYLLSGQFYNIAQPEYLRPSLKNCCERRNITRKLDIVAALWDDNVRTEDINEDILMEYQKGDCVSTAELYAEQLAQAERQNQMHMILGRMEGLLATTEMEFNGLYIDLVEAANQQRELEEEIEALREQLSVHVPALPAEIEFNWGSGAHLSALIFGGKIKYRAKAPILDDDGNPTYYNTQVRKEIWQNGEPVRYKGGKNAGKIKTKLFTVPDVERGPKERLEDFYYELPRQTKPHPAWKGKKDGQWSTKASVLEKLAERKDAPELIKDLLELRGKEKDLGTYYKRLYKGNWTGMLAMVNDDGSIHHNLDHFTTKTSRLASHAPNLQNLPGKGKSRVRQLFISRFGQNGLVVESDYSQLEVVCKAVLSGDKELMRKLDIGLCLHCDWLAQMPFGEGKSYEEIYKLCKIDHDEHWTALRKRVKPVTFGEAYGAGVPSLCESSGLDAETIQAAIDARKLTYPDMYQYDDDNIAAVKASRRPSSVRTEAGMQAGIGYLRSATDTIYHFIEGDAPDWMRHKGIMTSFKPTTIKNYPSQGLGGEIMQVQLGRVFRYLMENDRFNDEVLLINTVHDCVWLDMKEKHKAVLPEIESILEDVSPYFTEHYPGVDWDTPFPVETEIGPNYYELEPLCK
jgi:DNA polymerase-1